MILSLSHIDRLNISITPSQWLLNDGLLRKKEKIIFYILSICIINYLQINNLVDFIMKKQQLSILLVLFVYFIQIHGVVTTHWNMIQLSIA
jgi:hypothetical protein